MANPRNEIKFQINQQSAYLLDLRLKQILPKDRNSKEDNAYEITSLYFDDPSNFAYLDKINGINERVKYRLRYYNGNRDFIRLERKAKIGSQCLKDSCVVSSDTAEALARGEYLGTTQDSPLLSEFVHKIRFEGFRPNVFVHYRRRAYLYAAGNVRITLDDFLFSSPYRSSLFEERVPAVPVLSAGEVILEVKYDSFFPPFLSNVTEDIPKMACSVSKYCRCRELFL